MRVEIQDETQTHANFRNSDAAKIEVVLFLAWMRSQEELTPEEKEKLSRLADRYQKRRER